MRRMTIDNKKYWTVSIISQERLAVLDKGVGINRALYQTEMQLALRRD